MKAVKRIFILLVLGSIFTLPVFAQKNNDETKDLETKDFFSNKTGIGFYGQIGYPSIPFYGLQCKYDLTERFGFGVTAGGISISNLKMFSASLDLYLTLFKTTNKFFIISGIRGYVFAQGAYNYFFDDNVSYSIPELNIGIGIEYLQTKYISMPIQLGYGIIFGDTETLLENYNFGTFYMGPVLGCGLLIKF